MDVSFSGAGFMGCYYFGVVNCWNKYIPRDRVRRVAGASAGSLIAAYYLMELPLDDCIKEIVEMMEEVRSRPLGVFDRSNQIVDVLPRNLDKLFPEDAHKRVGDRLYVCMTRLKDFKSVVVNEFETRKDLIDALNCSCFIPVWSGNHVSTYKGVKYIDGGFTNNMPVFDEHTIRVSCFSGASDIAPYDRARIEMLKGNIQGMSVNLSWKNLRRAGRALWPPPPSFIMELLKFGFHDTKEFILDNDLIQCDRCFAATERELQPIYSVTTPTISPAPSPSVSRAPSHLNLAAVDLQLANGSSLGGSFRLRRSKRDLKRCPSGGRQQRWATQAQKKRDENWQPVRIKEHRRQSASANLFETNRNKSGKKIAREALERLRLESEQAERDQASPEASKKAATSFAGRLREKLQLVATRKAAREAAELAAAADASTEEKPPRDANNNGTILLPTIVVDETAPAAPTSKPMTILDIMKAQQEADEARASGSSSPDVCDDGAGAGSKLARRAGSMGSSASTDSAVVLEPVAQLPAVSSPAEKFLAGSASKRRRAQSLSLAAGNNNTGNLLAATAAEDCFALAPSPLPSCPPSPNLNRHCTECIRLRQQARMDALDESIKRAADQYASLKSKDPEREFSSIRWRLACWLRQLGAPKYSYSFTDDSAWSAAAGAGSDEADDDDEAVFAAGETMAERKAKRKASHPLAWPPSELQASS